MPRRRPCGPRCAPPAPRILSAALPGELDCRARTRRLAVRGAEPAAGLARAILADAPILLLDEVTSALDLETEQRVLENIAALPGKTCILSTHRPSVLSLCSRVYRLHNAALELLPESSGADYIGIIDENGRTRAGASEFFHLGQLEHAAVFPERPAEDNSIAKGHRCAAAFP